MAEKGRIDLDKPKWDQSTFVGRLKYFFWMTDFRNGLNSTETLEKSKELVELYEQRKEPPGTTEEELWQAKRLVMSAYHPDSGELQNVIGRMSFQVPGGMVITAGMLQFYKTTPAVILWQWINQSFNALVNYTNRNAASSISTKQMTIAYVTATTSAVVTAIGLKGYLAKRSSSLMQRFVPFVAVAAANMVNIPLSRQSELVNGVGMFDANGNRVTESKYAAIKGISQVTFSRITMAAPGMLIMPVVMESLEKRAWFNRLSRYHLIFQTFMIGAFLTFMVPFGCALFPQRSSIQVESLKYLDSEKLKEVQERYGQSMPKILYFNKGL